MSLNSILQAGGFMSTTMPIVHNIGLTTIKIATATIACVWPTEINPTQQKLYPGSEASKIIESTLSNIGK